MQKVDGVLEVEFVADYHAPRTPVTVRNARMTGIHPNMLATLRSRPLRDLGIVIRAHGSAPGLAVFPVVVVRDEAGNVRFVDDTGAAGQPSTWLARKGGSTEATPERAHRGAIALMDELLDSTLDQLVPRGVTTDHEETAP
jgi:hypothetical protein